VTELEADILAADILNRHELSLGRPTQSNPPSVSIGLLRRLFYSAVSDGYPGLAAIWKEERQRREALNIDDPLSLPPSPGNHRAAPVTAVYNYHVLSYMCCTIIIFRARDTAIPL
jgi:hypothetical protein